jgi:hypothetical protein
MESEGFFKIGGVGIGGSHAGFQGQRADGHPG